MPANTENSSPAIAAARGVRSARPAGNGSMTIVSSPPTGEHRRARSLTQSKLRGAHRVRSACRGRDVFWPNGCTRRSAAVACVPSGSSEAVLVSVSAGSGRDAPCAGRVYEARLRLNERREQVLSRLWWPAPWGRPSDNDDLFAQSVRLLSAPRAELSKGCQAVSLRQMAPRSRPPLAPGGPPSFGASTDRARRTRDGRAITTSASTAARRSGRAGCAEGASAATTAGGTHYFELLSRSTRSWQHSESARDGRTGVDRPMFSCVTARFWEPQTR
jgi:hypothetical protein